MYACLRILHRFNVLLDISVALVPCILAASPLIIFKSQGQLALPSNCPNSRPGLPFNAQKYNIISTGKESRPYFYQLDGCILKHVSNQPYLGVEFSESLTFSVHIANIVSSACQKLGFLRRNLKRFPRDVKALAYYALVRSKLEYCCTIWDPHQVGEVNRLGGSSATPRDKCAASIDADPA